MGLALQEEEVCRAKLQECEAALKGLADWSLLEELNALEGRSRLAETEIAQPAICALQLALAQLWRSWGIEPEAVVGHSVGEIAAAQVAGVLSVEEAMWVAVERGRLMERSRGRGGMVAVGLSGEQASRVIQAYGERLAVAAVNGPRSTVLSGESGALAEVVGKLEQQGVFTQALAVDFAFHSVQMDPHQAELVRRLERLNPGMTKVPVFSTVSGRRAVGGDFEAAYWGRNLREPVRFAEAIGGCVQEGFRRFLEVGAHPVLCVSIREILEDSGVPGQVVGSLRRQGERRRALFQTLREIYQDGQKILWEKVYPQPRPKVELPTYPWQRQRYWRGQSARGTWLSQNNATGHPLLGRLHSVATAEPGTSYWENTVDPAALPYFAEHVLLGVPVLAITVYLEMALAAAQAAVGDGPHELKDVRFQKILVVSEEEKTVFQVVFKRHRPRESHFEIYSRAAGSADWGLYAQGEILHGSGSAPRHEPDPRPPASQVPKFSLMFFAASADSMTGNLYRLAIQAARFADQNGFSGVWVPERHFTNFGGPYPNPAVLHAALARETRHVRLRAGSVVAALHNPIRIAEDWAMVDQLSEGRIEISFASGWNADDFALAPEAYANRYAEVFRGIEVVRRLWRGEPMCVRNGDGREIEIRTNPRPVQSELPVWVTASRSKETFVRAGEIGANLLTHLLDQDPALLGERIALYRSAREAKGFDPATGQVALMLHTFLGQDSDAVRELVRKPYCAYLKSIAPLLGKLATSRQSQADVASLPETEQDEFIDFLFERAFSSRSLLGTPESCQELVRELGALGVNDIACLLDFGPTTDQILGGLPFLRLLKEASAANKVPSTVPSERRLDPTEIQARCRREISRADYYSKLREHGIHDGPSYLAVEHLWAGDGEVLAKVQLRDELKHELSCYQCHPVFLAACFQVLSMAVPDSKRFGPGSLPSPVGLASYRVHKRPEGASHFWTHARLSEGETHTDRLVGNVHIFDFGGELVAEANGITLQSKAARTHVRPSLTDDLLYKLSWERLPLAKTPLANEEARTWVLLADEGGLAERLSLLLRARGHTCFLVSRRARNEASLEYHLYVQSDGASALPEVLQLLERRKAPPLGGVVYLWSQDCELEMTGSGTVPIAAGRETEDALNMIQTLAASKGAATSRFWIVTKGAQIAGGRTVPLSLSQATLWGLARVASVECREIWGGIIDLDPANSVEVCATHLFQSILGKDGEDQIAFQAKERYAARFVRWRPPLKDLGELRLSGQENYLITGGMGDLGLEVARWLVMKGARHLVLVGRTEIPPRDQWPALAGGKPFAKTVAAIQELERMGARVVAASADVGDQEQMSLLLDRLTHSGGPAIRGVIHCAAVFNGGMLTNLQPETLRAVLRPKVEGGWILHRLFEGRSLDFFVLFSAIPSLLGWIGQGAGGYAAANAFLDALAYHRRARGLPAISISWGPWDEVGVAARTDRGLDRLGRLGVGAIPPAQGLKLLERLILENPVHIAAAALNWPQFFQSSPGTETSLLLSAMARERSAPPPVRRGAITGWSLGREQLLATEPAERPQLLESCLSESVARVLGLPASKINRHRPLTELGLDSLMAIEIRTAIQENLGVALSLVGFLREPTLAKIAATILETMNHTTASGSNGLGVAAKATTLLPDRLDRGEVCDEDEVLAQLSDLEVDSLLSGMEVGGSKDELFDP
jgi:natural product biosynthesis luciferase-like monooxygenase protein